MSNNNDAQSAALNMWHRAWPLACLPIAALVNAAWIGLLTYGPCEASLDALNDVLSGILSY